MARLLARECGCDLDLRFEALLYGHGVEGYLGTLRSLPPNAAQPLLVGHKPRLEDLVRALRGARGGIRMPTAALAFIRAGVESWGDLQAGRSELLWLLIPRLVKALP